jgi:hypothetical protein
MFYQIRDDTHKEMDRVDAISERYKLDDRNGFLSSSYWRNKKANHGHLEEPQDEGTGKHEGLVLGLVP